jgi:hypothetical protein
MNAPLSRRSLFHAGLAGSALAALGRGLHAAGVEHGGTNCRFPGDLVPPSDPLIEARARARAVGKPLLAIAAPAEQAEQHRRGYVWGRFFSSAPDAALAPLAFCALECLPEDELVGRYPSCRRDDLAWLLFDGADAVPIAVSGADLGAAGEDAAELGRRLRAAIVPDEAAAARFGAVDGDDAELAMETILFDARPNLTLVGVAACAFVPRLAAGTGDERTIAALAAVAARDAWHDAPEGGAWAHQSSYCPPCGRGHVDATARHFLSLWVEE